MSGDVYAGVGREQLEQRLSNAERETALLKEELALLRTSNTALDGWVSKLTFENVALAAKVGLIHDIPRTKVAAATTVLARIVDACLKEQPSLTLADGTGGTVRFALRERARIEYEHSCKAQTLTWRQILNVTVADVLAESAPEKLSAALVRLGVVVVKWIEAIDARGGR